MRRRQRRRSDGVLLPVEGCVYFPPMTEFAKFLGTLESDFPGSGLLDDYIDGTHRALEEFGFSRDDSLAGVCVCRDELVRSFVKKVESVWGEAFNFSGLGGLFYAGTTGLTAAIHHAPQIRDREQYVFYVFPHLSLGEDGTYGVCYRAGRPKKSVACGALFAFAEGWLAGEMSLDLDPEDMEQSILRQRLARELSADTEHNLKEVTHLAQRAGLADLEALLAKVVDTSVADYAVFSGIHIHGPDHKEYISPATSYAVINGTKQLLQL